MPSVRHTTTMDCLRVATISILALMATAQVEEFTFGGDDLCSKNMSRCTELSQEGIGGADVWDKYGITPYLNLPNGVQTVPNNGRRRRSVRTRRQASAPVIPDFDPKNALLQSYGSYLAQGLPLQNLCDFIDGMDFDKMMEGYECTMTVVENCPDKFGLLAQSLKGSPLDYIYVRNNLCVKECENFQQTTMDVHQCELLSTPLAQTLEQKIKAAAAVNDDTKLLCQNLTDNVNCIREAGRCCPGIELSLQQGLPLIIKPEIIQMCTLDLTLAKCKKAEPVQKKTTPVADAPAGPVGQGVTVTPSVHLVVTLLQPIIFRLVRM